MNVYTTVPPFLLWPCSVLIVMYFTLLKESSVDGHWNYLSMVRCYYKEYSSKQHESKSSFHLEDSLLKVESQTLRGFY